MFSRTARVLATLLTVTALGAGALLQSVVYPPMAVTTTPDRIQDVTGQKIRILHFNFAGNGLNLGSTDLPVTDLVQKIMALQPDIITLNEVCIKQVTAIADALRTHTEYAALNRQSVKTNYSVPNCATSDPAYGDDDYAMSILSRWPMSFPTTVGDGGFYHSYTTIQPNRFRRVLCMNVTLPSTAGVITPCTTHLEEHHLTLGGTNINASQNSELADVLTSLAGAHRVLLAGDLNVLPDDDRLDELYGADAGGAGLFTETDQFDARWSTGLPSSRHGDITFAPLLMGDEVPGVDHTGTRKLDYVFAESSDFTVAANSASVIPSSYSDHMIVVSEVALR
ncbi:endonuclease/exonuclease/phosphatase family protein [Microbacterium sp. A94]|uniref:endonuclease/exonuclease/phosphatase family protein n=1 Tax=Microbacterium sp. A94 TaxID=3450717 RepID=UPI003F42B66C